MKTIGKGRKEKITDEMTMLMKSVPQELNHCFNIDEDELKSLFGLMYVIGNNFNTDTVTISRSKVCKDMGKEINSSKLISMVSQLKDRKLIERVNTSMDGTQYRLLFSKFQQSESNKQEELKQEEIIEQRNIPMAMPINDNSDILNAILQEVKSLREEVKELKEEISTLRDDNDKLKKGMKILNNKLNLLHYGKSTSSNETSIENSPKTSGNTSVINDKPSMVDLHAEEVEKPSESLKTSNSKIEVISIEKRDEKDKNISILFEKPLRELTNKELGRENNHREEKMNGWGVEEVVREMFSEKRNGTEKSCKSSIVIESPTIEENSSIIELYNGEAEKPLESLRISNINVNETEDKYSEAMNVAFGVENVADSNASIPKVSVEGKCDGPFTEDGRRVIDLANEKFKRQMKNEPCDDIDSELLSIHNKQLQKCPTINDNISIVELSINDVEKPSEMILTSKLPKYGIDRICAINQLSYEELLNERDYRNERGMQEDDLIEERISVLEKMQELHMKCPEPICEGVGLPF